MDAVIAVLPGDGIGPEVARAAVRVLEAVAQSYGHRFDFGEYPMGGAAIDACGDAMMRHIAVLLPPEQRGYYA